MLFNVSVVICNKYELLTSQGSAGTYLRCGGKYYEILLEISSSFQQWKKFENRLRFEKVIAKSLVASFFWNTVYIYASGIWSTDFLQFMMIPLEKKQNATRREDFRTISLICHASKILLKVLQKRIEAKTSAISFLTEDQFGFRKSRGTRDATATLRKLGGRSIEVGQDVCLLRGLRESLWPNGLCQTDARSKESITETDGSLEIFTWISPLKPE